jgi:hypothetical protein
MKWAPAGLALAALLGAQGAGARELWRRGEAYLDVDGAVRQLVVVTAGTDADDFRDRVLANLPDCAPADRFPDCPAFDVVGDEDVATSLTRLRLKVRLGIAPRLFAYVAYDHELLAGTLDTLARDLGDAIAPDPLYEGGGVIAGGDHVEWRHLLYRGFLAFEGERIGLRVGRQRIAWGVGRLWNPIDRFNAIPPLALEPDQVRGVDGVDAKLRFSGFTYLQAVYAVADDPDDRSYALRLHGVLRDVDYSVVAGVFEEALTLGFDLAGNLGEAAARLEVVWTDPDRDVHPVGERRKQLPRFWQVVGSVDHVFDVGTGLYLLVEHLYNGNDLGFGRGKAGPLLPFFEETGDGLVRATSAARFGGSRVITLGSNLTGLEVGYDLTPELRGDLLALYDWDGSSAAFVPRFTWSAFDWLELTLAGQLFTGPRRSEYGSNDHLGYLLAEIFF